MGTTETISVKSEDQEGVKFYDGFDETTEKQIQSLARQLSNTSTHQNSGQASSCNDLIRTLTSFSQVPGQVTFGEGDIDERLDPTSDQFDSKFWVKNIRKLMDSDPEHYKPSSLNIAYRNLCAKGIASDADYQPTVSNMPIKMFKNLYYNWIKANDESRFFQILKPMDALIKAGTLTVVLGRPGAGCSTLLKTIGAQTHEVRLCSQLNWIIIFLI
ncbi:unnamed protein product [Ambrosiozyma monospora]|uniref:Unnamed protein product n=1 Tax=Ambrosiozyma monospora TaxID=43982 RepID=A0ACB5SXY5_AMBMO|nr:unnamed protein product [Ambrosiozyma monospora]